MGCSKSSFKREVDRSTILPQETRKTSSSKPNSTLKKKNKKKNKKHPKLVEGKKS